MYFLWTGVPPAPGQGTRSGFPCLWLHLTVHCLCSSWHILTIAFMASVYGSGYLKICLSAIADIMWSSNFFGTILLYIGLIILFSGLCLYFILILIIDILIHWKDQFYSSLTLDCLNHNLWLTFFCNICITFWTNL